MTEFEYHELSDIKIDHNIGHNSDEMEIQLNTIQPTNPLVPRRILTEFSIDDREINGIDITLAAGLSLYIPISIVILLWWLQHNDKIQADTFALVLITIFTILLGIVLLFFAFVYIIYIIRKLFKYFFQDTYNLIASQEELHGGNYCISFMIICLVIALQLIYVRDISTELTAFLVISNILLFPHFVFIFYVVITLFRHNC